MEKQDTFGDFTILNEAMEGITGEPFSANDFEGAPEVKKPGEEGFEASGEFNKDEDEGKGEQEKADKGKKDEEAADGNGVNINAIVDMSSGEKSSQDNGATDKKTDTPANTKGDEGTEGAAEATSLFGEEEPEITAYMQEKLFEKLGWTAEDEEPAKDMDGLLDYMAKIAENASKPEFANEELESLNNFVKEGGTLRDFYGTQGELNIETLDMESENDQKRVVKEALIERGYSAEQASKKLNRYDESGILEEEAVDAKEFIVNLRKEKGDTLLKAQTLKQTKAKEQQQKFYTDVNSTINKMEDIRGLPLSAAEKKELRGAVLNIGQDGQTLYQKKYKEDLIKNMLESAYFTLKKDTLVKKLTKQAESQASKNLKKKIEARTKKGRVSGITEEENVNVSDHSALDIFKL